MSSIPLHFKVGPYSFKLVKEAVREFDQSKYEYEFEVFKGARCGFITLWFLPSRPTELKGSISYEMRGNLKDEECSAFCSDIFDFLKVEGFKTYGFSWGSVSEFVGPAA